MERVGEKLVWSVPRRWGWLGTGKSGQEVLGQFQHAKSDISRWELFGWFVLAACTDTQCVGVAEVNNLFTEIAQRVAAQEFTL